MRKIVNEYVYDFKMIKKFYEVNLQTNLFLVLLFLVLLSTISSFAEKDISFGFFSLIVLLLGCIYYFMLPLFLAKLSYSKLLEQNKKKNIKLRVIVNEKEIVLENVTSKTTNKYALESIKKIRERKDIICLITKEKVGILLSKDGFKSGNKEDLYSIIRTAKTAKNKKCNRYFTKNN